MGQEGIGWEGGWSGMGGEPWLIPSGFSFACFALVNERSDDDLALASLLASFHTSLKCFWICGTHVNARIEGATRTTRGRRPWRGRWRRSNGTACYSSVWSQCASNLILQPTLIATCWNVSPTDAALFLLAEIAALSLIAGYNEVLHIVSIVVHSRAAHAFA